MRETIREVGILIVVLVPLDAAFGAADVNVTIVGLMIVFGVILIGCGILMET